MDNNELIGRLNDAAEECFKEQVNGWGNLMGYSADRIAILVDENNRMREALGIYANPENWQQKDTRTGAFDWFLRGFSGWDIADAALVRTLRIK